MQENWRKHPDLPPSGSTLCRLDEIPDGGGHLLSFGEGEKPLRILLLRSGNDVRAWHNYCPHFGMPLATRDDLLIVKAHENVKCNVHYARFRWQDGVCDDGECVGEGLAAIPVKCVDGEIFLAT